MTHEQGKLLLLNAYSVRRQAKAPKRGKIREFLHRIFHTKDDEYIEEVIKSCRGSSYRLMSYIDKDPQMHYFTDNAITNFILLILCDQEGKAAKIHSIKKQFSLFCTIAEKAIQQQDHNTAWILDKALRSPVLDRIEFKRPKRYKGVKDKIYEQHGGHERLYFKHIQKCIEAHEKDDPNFIPVAPVLDMHRKRSNVYEKTLKERGRNSWYLEGKKHREKIDEIVDYAKITLGQNTWAPLTKLYTRSPKRRSHKDLFELCEIVQEQG